MAFHKAILILFFLSFVAFQLSKADTIDDVCSTTPDADFCKSAFRSDSRSAGADLQTLAQIGIDLAQSHTGSASSLVKSLGKKATDPKVKGIYDSCRESYDDASGALKDSASDLKSKDYSSLNIHASAALDSPSTCDDGFTELSVPEPGELIASGKQVQTLCSAVVRIANKLQGN